MGANEEGACEECGVMYEFVYDEDGGAYEQACQCEIVDDMDYPEFADWNNEPEDKLFKNCLKLKED